MEFKDLSTLKRLFLSGYNPWGKTKRDQWQSLNILSFDPQKTNVDEQIDLVVILGDILGQDKQSKMEKFSETMPTIIQTHLIIKPDWKHVTKKAKELEHIIQKCETLVIAPASMQATAAVPSLYSHIAHHTINTLMLYLNHLRVPKVEEVRNQARVNKKHNSSLNHLPLP